VLPGYARSGAYLGHPVVGRLLVIAAVLPIGEMICTYLFLLGGDADGFASGEGVGVGDDVFVEVEDFSPAF